MAREDFVPFGRLPLYLITYCLCCSEAFMSHEFSICQLLTPVPYLESPAYAHQLLGYLQH